MIIISTFLTVPGQPSPRFHVGAWLPFRKREMDYLLYFDVTTSRPESLPLFCPVGGFLWLLKLFGPETNLVSLAASETEPCLIKRTEKSSNFFSC